MRGPLRYPVRGAARGVARGAARGAVLAFVLVLLSALTVLAMGSRSWVDAEIRSARRVAQSQRVRRAALGLLSRPRVSHVSAGDSRLGLIEEQSLMLPGGLEGTRVHLLRAPGIVEVQVTVSTREARARASMLLARIDASHWVVKRPAWMTASALTSEAVRDVLSTFEGNVVCSSTTAFGHRSAFQIVDATQVFPWWSTLGKSVAANGEVVVVDGPETRTIPRVVSSGGEVRVAQGVHLRGLVLAEGGLLLDSGSSFHGLAWVRGPIAMAADADLQIDPCSALEALEAEADSLGWVPLYSTRGFLP